MTVPAQTPTIAPADFRRVMGRFATGLTVITAEAGGKVRGMTASAFMSGSLDPPLIIVSIARKAAMHDHLLAAGRFAVQFLGAGQQDVAMHFAGRPAEGLRIEFVDVGGIPTLDGSATVITAETYATHACGDHTIFVGRILSLRADERPPLVYHAGRFGVLASEVTGPIPEFW